MAETRTPLWWLFVAWGFFGGLMLLSSFSAMFSEDGLEIWATLSFIGMVGFLVTTGLLWGQVE